MEENLAAHHSAITLVEKTEYRQYLEVARDCITDKVWGDACTALQLILNSDEDYYVQIEDEHPQTGHKIQRWTSVKYEANKLLGTMPAEGLKVYEQRFGRKAEILLGQAKQLGDLELLGRVSQKYFHTKVGAIANDLLATYFLDRGQFFVAALQFDRLISLSSKQVKIKPLTLFKATLAFQRAGDLEKADAVWKMLMPHLQEDGGLRINGQLVSVAKLQRIRERIPRPQTVNPRDWTLVRGNPSNTAQMQGSQPLLGDLLWFRPSVRDKSDITGDYDPGAGIPSLIAAAHSAVNDMPGVPVMPGFFPIAVEGKVIYRTYSGMAAVNLYQLKDNNGQLVDNPGTIYWKGIGFDGGLARSLSDVSTKDKLSQWVEIFKSQHPDFMYFIYENSLVGTISADAERVYAIDDIAVPVPPSQVNVVFSNSGTNLPQKVRDRVMQNGLQAYNLETGKNVWTLGYGDRRKLAEFEDSHFLGPPLPVGGKLYAMNEKNNGELRLITIDPKTGTLAGPIQNLGTVESYARIARDANRRVHAVHMAYAEGILVCPTNAGQILGIDLLTRSLAWAYPYREGKKQAPNQQIGLPPGLPPPNVGLPLPLTPATWKVAPPSIAKGKVVFTAPDAQSLHCVNLRDGTMAWKHPKSDSDLFLAGVWKEKVLLVSRNTVYALNLADGRMAWPEPATTGSMPSGQGAASDDIYYLPLQNGEICAIDIDTGKIRGRNRPTSGEAPAPGNLVFYKGMVLSQTSDKIVAYPQLIAKLNVVKAEVKKNPGDLAKQVLLGELHLANGEVHKAIDIFHNVKDKNPPATLQPQLEQRLYEALTDLFQVDFKTAKVNYLNEYTKLCAAPKDVSERERRQARFYRLLGDGLESEGDLVEAFSAYRKYVSLPLIQKGDVPARDDPLRKIPAKIWLRGRIAEMFAKAPNDDKKKALENKIQQEWRKVRNSGEINGIRTFVAMFDVPFPVGQEARLHLADAIIDNNNPSAFLEAELALEQLRSGRLGEQPNPGGKALEALARLEIRKGSAKSMKLAAEYYRRLAEQFPDREIRDGKTGMQLYKELYAKKIFLPYLEQSGPLWSNGQFKYRELKTEEIAANLNGFMFRPKGDLNAHTRQLRLVLETTSSNPKLRIVDGLSNKDIATHYLGHESLNAAYFNFLHKQITNNPDYFPDAHFRFARIKGHLAMIQVGATAYAIDLNNPGVRWRYSLVQENQIPPNSDQQQVMPDQDGNLELVLRYNRPVRRTLKVRIGYVAAVQASYVCIVQQDRIVVVDPLSEKNNVKVLWTRENISEQTKVFGDEQYIYLVDVNGKNANNGRALRVSDGKQVAIADFSALYQKRQQMFDSHILASDLLKNKLVVRLYHIPSGKDVWKGEYHPDSALLQTVDPYLTGVIEPSGKMTVVDLKKQEVVLETSVLSYRITKKDLAKLHDPLLLADRDHFYVALNQEVDQTQVEGGTLNSNFGNGLRCAVVNGWFGAFHRSDGSKMIHGERKTWKKGDLHWYSSRPITNQLILLDQFEKLPLILFSVRYHELAKGGIPVNQWISVTQSLDKSTGKWVYIPFTPRLTNGASPRFKILMVDVEQGTINMIGYNGILQHYLYRGKNAPTKAGPTAGAAASDNRQTKLPKEDKSNGPNLVIQRPGQPPIIIGPNNPLPVIPPQPAPNGVKPRRDKE